MKMALLLERHCYFSPGFLVQGGDNAISILAIFFR